MTLALAYRAATSADVPMLARMNQQLIEDEGHRNPMRLTELESRMRSMLEVDYTATLFETVSTLSPMRSGAMNRTGCISVSSSWRGTTGAAASELRPSAY